MKPVHSNSIVIEGHLSFDQVMAKLRMIEIFLFYLEHLA